MAKKAKNIEFFDHTADVGFIARATNLQSLFRLAASTMFRIICPTIAQKNELSFTINLAEDDLEQLLVNWLSELNILFQTEQFLLAGISELQISDNNLHAIVNGERIDPEKHEIELEIKAVTYHQLYVRKLDAHWEARIIFDI